MGDGQERSKSFAKKADADRHLRRVVADLETCTYADPQRSAVTFGTVAEAWIAAKAPTVSRKPLRAIGACSTS
ncbi:hypothetical protein [Mycolicibacterium senegalense]|uniref:hypothetical protein n=1 Tax=Mycolicibacterium senegalense TaxID=1796 RepID=UPI0002E0E094|nr:hypothetical protein [Mycolicibacterium senegalense]